MAPNGIMRSGDVRCRRSEARTRRGRAAGAALFALILVALAGCGAGGSSTSATTAAATTPAGATVATPALSAEEAADADLLNHVLGRQEAAIAAYEQVIPKLAPRLAHMAAYFRAQEAEHVDAVLKALRGLKSAAAEPSEEAIDVGDLATDRERLEFLYAVESATIDEELSAIASLEASWPRSLLASTVANQAQHLTLLRQALGAGPLASVPAPFENGTAAPPE
jgi:hypothetical protein